jgi:hypothetical protein
MQVTGGGIILPEKGIGHLYVFRTEKYTPRIWLKPDSGLGPAWQEV